MPRDVRTEPPPTHPAPLRLFDPYSQQVIVCTRPGGAARIPRLLPVPDGEPAAGPSRASRLLQLALLSSVAVVIWFLLRILQATG
jgi:hypothetical protein